jgi:site-specific DNA recombinase
LTKPAATRRGTVRCAIYTRKSSEEGLEQEFNSLQAQREACEAFIASQRHEGWACLATRYDDGGFSGATTDRPALQRLLADIAAGRVDTIVVYKIDRLTPSRTSRARFADDSTLEGAGFEPSVPHKTPGVRVASGVRSRRRRISVGRNHAQAT